MLKLNKNIINKNKKKNFKIDKNTIIVFSIILLLILIIYYIFNLEEPVKGNKILPVEVENEKQENIQNSTTKTPKLKNPFSEKTLERIRKENENKEIKKADNNKTIKENIIKEAKKEDINISILENKTIVVDDNSSMNEILKSDINLSSIEPNAIDINKTIKPNKVEEPNPKNVNVKEFANTIKQDIKISKYGNYFMYKDKKFYDGDSIGKFRIKKIRKSAITFIGADWSYTLFLKVKE